MAYLFVAMTILLTVYGQLVLKWQVGLYPHLVSTPFSVTNIVTLLLKPWVISGFAAAFGASICWMAAISKLPLSRAYPFMSINFVLVAVVAAWLFHENLDAHKLTGTCIIVIGVIVLSRSTG
jgi:multidrug transporter EmrE-like cation transporter